VASEDAGSSGRAILHVFADHGVEAEVLTQFGDVTRYTLNPRQHEHSAAVRGDASQPTQLPFKEGEFDLVVAHPPCTAWSDMPDANKNGDAPKLIAEAREIGQRYGAHYVVENKPTAPLHDPTVLEGRMFGLPIRYERAFETSFPVPQPPSMGSLGTETSPFYYSERSHEWWAAAKGYPVGEYPKEHMAKNCIPAPYIRHLVRAWLTSTAAADGVADYSNYDAEMDEQRARAANSSLGDYS
jgi:hypothetical protein